MLFDDRRHFTHFTGFLLDEEIVASLWVIRNAKNENRLRTETEINFLYWVL
jgi:hypothetical protein